MRGVLLFLMSIAAASAAFAQEKTKPRVASEAEIREKLTGAGELKDGGDGYEYRTGNKNGYKISNGKICVKDDSRRVNCVTVYSDGERLEIIDRRGNREFLN